MLLVVELEVPEVEGALLLLHQAQPHLLTDLQQCQS